MFTVQCTVSNAHKQQTLKMKLFFCILCCGKAVDDDNHLLFDSAELNFVFALLIPEASLIKRAFWLASFLLVDPPN